MGLDSICLQKLKAIWLVRTYDYQPTNSQVILKDQRQLMLAWSHDDMRAQSIAHLNTRVLILNGQGDGVIPSINSLILKNITPNSTILFWPNGGHAMSYQYPKDIASVINDFTVKEKRI